MHYQGDEYSNGNAAREAAKNLLASGVNVPPMPSVGTKIFKMVQKPIDRIDTRDLCKLIEPDPGLYSKLLQVANSPFYRGVDEIIGLRSAVTRIGLEETVNAVNLYFVQQFLPKIDDLHGLSANDYWAFTWACATAAKRLGHPNISQSANPGELYIAGLLQGIGRLILAVYHTDEFANCLDLAKEFKLPLQNVLLERFGTTDSLIASELISTWNIPKRICAAVEFCHEPQRAPDEYQEFAGLTQLAYRLASLSKFGQNGDGVVLDLNTAWILNQPTGNLSNPKFQKDLTEDVLDLIEKKAEMISSRTEVNDDDDAEKKASDEPRPVQSPRLRPRMREQKPKGLWAKIKSFFT